MRISWACNLWPPDPPSLAHHPLCAQNGLGLTYADQLAYNLWLADTAHSMGLACGLKNDLGQVGPRAAH